MGKVTPYAAVGHWALGSKQSSTKGGVDMMSLGCVPVVVKALFALVVGEHRSLVRVGVPIVERLGIGGVLKQVAEFGDTAADGIVLQDGDDLPILSTRNREDGIEKRMGVDVDKMVTVEVSGHHLELLIGQSSPSCRLIYRRNVEGRGPSYPATIADFHRTKMTV